MLVMTMTVPMQTGEDTGLSHNLAGKDLSCSSAVLADVQSVSQPIAALLAEISDLHDRVAHSWHALIKRLSDDCKPSSIGSHQRGKICHKVYGCEVISVSNLQCLQKRCQAIVAEAQGFACIWHRILLCMVVLFWLQCYFRGLFNVRTFLF